MRPMNEFYPDLDYPQYVENPDSERWKSYSIILNSQSQDL